MSMKKRIGLIGVGTIGGFVLDNVMEGKVDNVEIVVAAVRNENSRGIDKLDKYEIPWVTDPKELLNYNLDAVVEVATQETLEEIGEMILEAGIDLIPISLGAFVDGNFLDTLTKVAEKNNTNLYIPSGGIGALDALKAAAIAGVDKATMTTRKHPVAWTNIPYIEEMGLNLDSIKEEYLLYEGPARDCVKKFPQNINIAAALSLAGIGFDKTIIRIIIDPEVKYNTHSISVEGKAGNFNITFENEPVPSNPKTTYQACLSVLAVLQKVGLPLHMGS